MKRTALFLSAFFLLLCPLLPAQWMQVGYMIVNSSDTANTTHSISGFGSDVYGCTNKGLFRSGDNGLTWQNLTWNATNTQNEEMYSVLAASNNDLYAGSGFRLYKSTDNGSTWTWLNTLPDSLEYNSIAELNGNIIAAYNKSYTAGGAYYSSNGGATWTLATGLPNLPMFGLLVDGSTIFLGGKNGVYTSTDNGQTWAIAGTGLSTGSYRSVIRSGNALFTNDVFGSGLFVSRDNGATWSNTNPTVFNGFCQVFAIVESQNMILASMDGACNSNSAVKNSVDTGYTWNTFMNNLPTGYYPVMGKNGNGTSFFASKGNSMGKIFRYDLATGMASTEQTPAVMVYPNPFTTSATVTVSNINMQPAEFMLYDLAGKMVQRILVHPSQSTFVIGRGELAAGLYFYELKNGAERIARGKIIVE